MYTYTIILQLQLQTSTPTLNRYIYTRGFLLLDNKMSEVVKDKAPVAPIQKKELAVVPVKSEYTTYIKRFVINSIICLLTGVVLADVRQHYYEEYSVIQEQYMSADSDISLHCRGGQYTTQIMQDACNNLLRFTSPPLQWRVINAAIKKSLECFGVDILWRNMNVGFWIALILSVGGNLGNFFTILKTIKNLFWYTTTFFV